MHAIPGIALDAAEESESPVVGFRLSIFMLDFFSGVSIRLILSQPKGWRSDLPTSRDEKRPGFGLIRDAFLWFIIGPF